MFTGIIFNFKRDCRIGFVEGVQPLKSQLITNDMHEQKKLYHVRLLVASWGMSGLCAQNPKAYSQDTVNSTTHTTSVSGLHQQAE